MYILHVFSMLEDDLVIHTAKAVLVISLISESAWLSPFPHICLSILHSAHSPLLCARHRHWEYRVHKAGIIPT